MSVQVVLFNDILLFNLQSLKRLIGPFTGTIHSGTSTKFHTNRQLKTCPKRKVPDVDLLKLNSTSMICEIGLVDTTVGIYWEYSTALISKTQSIGMFWVSI